MGGRRGGRDPPAGEEAHAKDCVSDAEKSEPRPCQRKSDTWHDRNREFGDSRRCARDELVSAARATHGPLAAVPAKDLSARNNARVVLVPSVSEQVEMVWRDVE